MYLTVKTTSTNNLTDLSLPGFTWSVIVPGSGFRVLSAAWLVQKFDSNLQRVLFLERDEMYAFFVSCCHNLNQVIC